MTGPDLTKSQNEKIAVRLKAARKAAAVSQQAAGDALGVTFQQIQKYENGTNRLSLGSLSVLASLYGKPVAYFFKGLNGTAEGTDEIEEFMGLPNAQEIARRWGRIIEKGDRAGADAVLAVLRIADR